MENSDIKLPSMNLWSHLAKLAITEDKPIMLDYWVESLNKDVVIGLTEDNEKLLVKNEEEYTSPIVKIFKIDEVYIICTENSIYLTSSNIEKKKIKNN
jgi:hypothetical protein|tara:strand:- start:515 stop:808 length:294 start_codon:yes stop_codon:yes gene_type:complete